MEWSDQYRAISLEAWRQVDVGKPLPARRGLAHSLRPAHSRTHPQGVHGPEPAAWIMKLSLETYGRTQDDA